MDADYGARYRDLFERHWWWRARERVILDALRGDPTLFIRADEVGRSWRIVDPILRSWTDDDSPIPLYQAATWGPREAIDLLERDGRQWRHS